MSKKNELLNIFSERLKELRNLRHLSLSKLSKLSTISSSTLSDYEIGKKAMPSLFSACMLADALDVDVDYLAGRTHVKRRKYGNLATSEDLPVYSSASCGTGAIPLETPIDHLAKPVDVEGDFWVLASGDSMFPKISDGDKLLVKTTTIVKERDIVIVLHENEILCKILSETESSVVLMSENKAYGTIILSKKDAGNKIIGRVTLIASKNF